MLPVLSLYNYIGRILNRFSKDVGFIDNLLPQVMFEFLQLFVRFLGILITSAVANNYLAIVATVVMIVFVLFRSYYLKTGRDVKRLEAIGTPCVHACMYVYNIVGLYVRCTCVMNQCIPHLRMRNRNVKMPAVQ